MTDEVLRGGKEAIEEVVQFSHLYGPILQRSLGPEDFLEDAPVGSPLGAILHKSDVKAHPSHPGGVSKVNRIGVEKSDLQVQKRHIWAIRVYCGAPL